ncbi:MAG: rod shape-determining protein MreC, partial [Proteobacteria bacterium]|nr:rod shape-determining protein MreC [Pseudomonadota bacterium]
DAVLVDRTRAHVTDAMAPLLAAVSKPVATVASKLNEFRQLADIRGENKRLRETNQRLLQWQTTARALMAENRSLRGLLNVPIEAGATFISARVIADTGGAFSHNLVINTGARDGVRKGQAVLSDRGFIGRIADVGERTSRVLLITDLNSRIPIYVESSRTPAILAGNNAQRPQLIHMPPDIQISPSDRIVTSGHGGAFPAGLPIGVVAVVTENRVEVQPFVERSRLEFVRVVEYGLRGVLDPAPSATAKRAPVAASAKKAAGAKPVQ